MPAHLHQEFQDLHYRLLEGIKNFIDAAVLKLYPPFLLNKYTDDFSRPDVSIYSII
ncbi:hypothetical protein H6F98_10685 [Microcoleus sp. FACHB-SPT15]|uniref:hypothetical protein n=1 Tax=Microcoleus sp. FACHB-SPT15 TaxID=2692830 RepID=UPI00177DD6D1|nr:hypothetical protein [Microcoleus sp. FACHB-SPT15]MBD1805915.1 hypothetical protein [Microcoleus sp. FACHB-SPT15]